MFRSLFHDHLQGSSFVLSAFTTFQLLASSFVFFGYVAVCHLFVCVSGVAVCVLSGRETTRQHTDRYIFQLNVIIHKNRHYFQIKVIVRKTGTIFR
jgi:type II secretory pathway component PulF